jgi:hypothetical protein
MVRWNPDPKFLADLRLGHRLFAHCPTCKRAVPLDVAKLEAKCGPYATLDEVRKRLRCTKCRQYTQKLRLVIERR